MKTITLFLLLFAFSLHGNAACSAYANVSANSCDTYCNGQIMFGISGGTAPYTLYVDNAYLTTFSADGSWMWNMACPGGHSYRFTDAFGCNATGTFVVYYRNPIPNSTITAGGPLTFCAPGTVTLTASPGYFYQWYRNGASIQGASANTYVATTSGDYYCLLMDYIFCNVNSNTIHVEVSSLPSSTITAGGSTTICNGNSVVLNSAAGTGFTYQWRLNTVAISGATQVSYTATAAGSYSCVVTNSCGAVTTNAITVTVVTGFPTATISAAGSTTLCTGGSVTLNANTGSNLFYSWLRNGSSIQGATNAAYAATSSGTYSCMVYNACGSAYSNSIVVTSGNAVINILNGTSSLCNGPATMSASAGTAYQWRMNGVTIQGATNGMFTITVAGSYDCLITNSCGTLASNVLSFTGVYLASANISSSATSFCPGGSVTFTASAGTGIAYQWRKDGAGIAGATQTFYSATAAGGYDCVYTTVCGTFFSNTINITTLALPVASIGVLTTNMLCPGSTVTMSANNSTGYGFQWQLNGVSIGGATTYLYVASVTGNYTCIVSNTCGSVVSNTIPVVAPVPPTISANGSTAICTGGSVLLQGYQSTATAYQWRLNGSNIAGATSQNYTATSAGNYDCLITNPCGVFASNVIAVTSGALPAASIVLNGPASHCPNVSVTFTANTGTGLNYQWRRAFAAISGATSSSYTTANGGYFDCIISNTCGSSTSNGFTITVTSTVSAVITPAGPTSFCSGGSVLLNSITGTGLTYQWKKNNVAISGATNSSYTATTAGSYTVTITNSCGAFTTAAVTVSIISAPAMPGAISGPATFCAYQTGVVYSVAPVPNATSYVWDVPNGAVIASNNGNSIVVNFGNKSGNIRVSASNACGSSSFRQLKVTKTCREGGIAEDDGLSKLMVFPNPSSVSFMLQLSETENNVLLVVSDMTGRQVEKKEIAAGSQRVEFGATLPAGIYFAEIISADFRKVIKLIKEKQ